MLEKIRNLDMPSEQDVEQMFDPGVFVLSFCAAWVRGYTTPATSFVYIHTLPSDSHSFKSTFISSSMTTNRLDFQTLMCRYESGRFVTRMMPLKNLHYVAVSHVWGEVEWRSIPGVEGDVSASREKAKFIAERLHSIVGSEYFWMDILCVNQRDSDKRVAVTQHIPAIFRQAQRTIVVHDRIAFRDCCLQVMRDQATWASWECHKRIDDHHFQDHECNGESILTRAWVVQEILLSDRLKFVHSFEPPRKQSVHTRSTPVTTIQVFRGLNNLYTLWKADGGKSDSQ